MPDLGNRRSAKNALVISHRFNERVRIDRSQLLENLHGLHVTFIFHVELSPKPLQQPVAGLQCQPALNEWQGILLPLEKQLRELDLRFVIEISRIK